jgi:4-amino-4-deoxy-L-arabinose transferase-like glycosyltransferase
MSTAAVAPARSVAVAARPWAGVGERVAAMAVFTLAAALRIVALRETPLDPFYDAAVRGMGSSWHAFFVGAFDPSARLAIDKPPVDLWLQVGATKLLGFGPGALLAPAAIGGTLAVVALYDLLRTLAGPRAALAGAAALAVLPVSVLTSRSDTMDSVMAALAVGALAVAARGLRAGRVRNMVAAGALVGLAFEVKLFEALVVAVPLALLWLAGARASRRRRAAGLGAAALAGAAVGLAWLVAVTATVPAHQRPWAFGSTDGSAWNAAFVYDGWDRLTGGVPHGGPSARARVPAAPGPLRLVSAQDHLGSRLGVELVAAWAALALVAATGAWRALDRSGRAGLAALAVWLALGTLLFSAQGALRPRYLEAFDPAVAACLGAGTVLAAARARAVAWPLLAGALAASAVASGAVAAAHAQDSGSPGAMPAASVARLSAYLRAEQGSARYEVASLSASPVAPVVAHDGRPVLVLSAVGHPLVSVARLRALVARGEVRDALVSARPQSAAERRLATWIRHHGRDAGRAAGLRRGRLYAISDHINRRT